MTQIFPSNDAHPFGLGLGRGRASEAFSNNQGYADALHEFYSTCCHEATHFFVAEVVEPGSAGAVLVSCVDAGGCICKSGLTQFQIGKVSIAGNMGENWQRHVSRRNKRPTAVLGKDPVALFVEQSTPDTFSPPDADGFFACPDRLRVAKETLAILTHYKRELEIFSAYLADLFYPIAFNPRLQGRPGCVDSIFKERFLNALYWHEAKENFNRHCDTHGISAEQRSPIIAMHAEMMGIDEHWITAPRNFLAKLLKKSNKNKQTKKV